MKRIYIIIAFMLSCSILAGCGRETSNTVKIAVLGSDDLYPCYKDGTQKAADDAAAEYKDSGLDIEYEFYDYDGSYESGAAIVGMLSEDESVTAVIGSVDMDLNKTAAHIFNSVGKLFIIPFFSYDSIFEENNYSTVFSMCNSAEGAGEIVRRAAAKTSAKRWAVCATDGEFEKVEMDGFVWYDADDGIVVSDCVDISDVDAQFDNVYERWKTLGVEGVALFVDDSVGFDLLKKIKSVDPDMVCAGDTAFDDSDVTAYDDVLRKAMTGFIMVNEYKLNIKTDEDEKQYEDLIEQYSKDTGKELDLWYIQGYNAVKMIADTAAGAGTSDPAAIASALHENGYSGIFQELKFSENGETIDQANTYGVFNENGYVVAYSLEE